MRPGFQTVPVICPAFAAARLKLNDQTARRRIYGEHVIEATEMSGWRWVAAQVYPRPDGRGVFPWERKIEVIPGD